MTETRHWIAPRIRPRSTDPDELAGLTGIHWHSQGAGRSYMPPPADGHGAGTDEETHQRGGHNWPRKTVSREFEDATFAKVAMRLIPFLFICYIVAFLDRVNVVSRSCRWRATSSSRDAVYGFGAASSSSANFIFEVRARDPEKVGARSGIARIMITWGNHLQRVMFVNSEFWFYTCVSCWARPRRDFPRHQSST